MMMTLYVILMTPTWGTLAYRVEMDEAHVGQIQTAAERCNKNLGGKGSACVFLSEARLVDWHNRQCDAAEDPEEKVLSWAEFQNWLADHDGDSYATEADDVIKLLWSLANHFHSTYAEGNGV